jgi:hypothetical protein
MSELSTTAEAEQAIVEMSGLIEDLRSVIELETALVQAGQLRKATTLGPAKSELAAKVHAGGEKLKRHAKFLLQSVPNSLVELNKLQDNFRAVLQRNMTVLATSHAVSEGIVRRLSSDLARKAAPKVYGASGRTVAPSSRFGTPLAVSRSL